MLLPSPAAIVSASMPPKTMSSPLPVVIRSEPPVVEATVVTSPSVIGSAPNRDVFCADA